MVLVKTGRARGFCINQQGIGRDLRARLQTTVYSQTEEGCAQALAFANQAAGQAAHAKTRNGIRGQLFPLGGAELISTDLRRAQGVVAQNGLGGACVNQDKNRTHALGVLLRGVFLQVSIKNRFATAKAHPVMQRRV